MIDCCFDCKVAGWNPQDTQQKEKCFLKAVANNCSFSSFSLDCYTKTTSFHSMLMRRTFSLFVSFLCHRFFQSCHRPSHTRWTASWGTSRTVKRTTAPNVQHGPARQGCTWAAAAAPHLCLILCLLELLLSETLAHESGHTKATQGISFRVTGIR